MYQTVIKVMFDFTLSIQDNEDILSELLQEFDCTKVILHLDEIGILVKTKEESDKLTNKIVEILTREKYLPRIMHK